VSFEDPFLNAAARAESARIADPHEPLTGHRIGVLWAYLAVAEDDDEGIISTQMGGMAMPLIGSDEARMRSLRPYAERIARGSGRQVKLVRFDQRTDIEVIN